MTPWPPLSSFALSKIYVIKLSSGLHAKGQLIWKGLYEIIVWTKIPTKFLIISALALSGQKLSNFSLVFWSKRWLQKDILKLTDLYFCLIYFEWTLKWKYLLRLLPPFKIVQLIRDPRGTMASISKGNKLNFKQYRKNILNGKFCEMMINDSNLEQHLPSNR